MIAKRTPFQKLMLQRMSAYWTRKQGQRKKSIKKPWRHELLKGTLYVRWLLSTQDVRYSTPMGILIDWCELNGMKWAIHPTRNLPYAKYIPWYCLRSQWVLTVAIK